MAVKTARCRCELRYVPKFTAASRGHPCDSTALVYTCNYTCSFVFRICTFSLFTKFCRFFAGGRDPKFLTYICKSGHRRTRSEVWWRLTKRHSRLDGEKKKEDVRNKARKKHQQPKIMAYRPAIDSGQP